MPANPLIFTSGVAAAVAISGSTEIVVATVSGVTDRYSGQTIKLNGQALVTTGTTTTAVVMRIRRQSLTGTLVNDQTGQTITSAAGGTGMFDAYGTDNPGDVANFTYVLTVQNTGGGTGGTTVYAYLEARVD